MGERVTDSIMPTAGSEMDFKRRPLSPVEEEEDSTRRRKLKMKDMKT